MGFETLQSKNDIRSKTPIMIASLWDLKPYFFFCSAVSLFYHDSFPMGFETQMYRFLFALYICYHDSFPMGFETPLFLCQRER